jgi:ADP-heptose:LPS heptosyltransferase
MLLAAVTDLSQIPSDYIVSTQPPPPAVADARRMLLILGPAIGVGDEIVTFPLASWLKARNPPLHLTVLSGYSGLWNRVANVDRLLHYDDHHELIRAMRGELAGQCDILALVDFEKPQLVAPLCAEAGVPVYLELSLGAQSAFVVDNQRRRVHGMPRPTEHVDNYYRGLRQMAEWIGLHPSADSTRVITRRPPERVGRGFRLFVSPFTSKHDPSAAYWSRLAASLVRPAPAKPVEVVFDPGPNLTTERFGALVLRSAAARSSAGVSFSLASSGGQRTLGLAEVFDALEHCDAVICTDSFAAHAAALFQVPTFVVAGTGLENWRVPAPLVYYFDLDAPTEAVAAAMRYVLARWAPSVFGAVEESRLISRTCRHLDSATREAASRLDAAARGGNGGWSEAHAQLAAAIAEAVDTFAAWPADAATLLRDADYRRPWRTAGEGDSPLDPEVMRHARGALDWWENTNLRKLSALHVTGSPHPQDR